MRLRRRARAQNWRTQRHPAPQRHATRSDCLPQPHSFGCHEARRTRKLQRGGFRIVRISAQLVLSDLPATVALVRAASSRKRTCKFFATRSLGETSQVCTHTLFFDGEGSQCDRRRSRCPSSSCRTSGAAPQLPPPAAPLRVTRSAARSPKCEHAPTRPRGGRRRAAGAAGEHRRVPPSLTVVMRGGRSGERGIRTLGRLLTYVRLASGYLRPLGHLSSGGVSAFEVAQGSRAEGHVKPRFRRLRAARASKRYVL